MRDRSKAGRSKLISYIQGEEAGDRHHRRLGFNLNYESEVRTRCEALGLTLKILNNGQHWQFMRGSMIAEWWPSSAKLVINKNWRGGIHCHDWQQVLLVLEQKCTS